MMNAIPGKILGKLALPFLLVHGIGHDENTWIPIFSVCYFHHDCNGDKQRSKHQAHTMNEIVICHLPTSNVLLVYNPRNKQYYELNIYWIDHYCLLGSAYPDIKYDDDLFCHLPHENNPHMEEKYPLGTRAYFLDLSTNTLLAGTIMDIPLHSST